MAEECGNCPLFCSDHWTLGEGDAVEENTRVYSVSLFEGVSG